MISLRFFTICLFIYGCKTSTTIKKLPLSGYAGNTAPIKGDYPPIGPGTDKSLYNPDLFQGDIYISEDVEPRNAVVDPEKIWPYAAVIYTVDDNIGCPNSPQCKMLMKAIDHFQERTCVRFKAWTGEDNYVRIFYNAENSGSCWSQVGLCGNEQKVSLSRRCWYFGIVLHELSHSLGFYHEMNRPDRDNYITIYWNNIIPAYTPSFAKYSRVYDNLLGEPFDYNSVMLYDEYAFSKDTVSPTVVANDGRVIGPIWKKTKLSDVDIRRIFKLYACDGTKTKSGFPYDIKCSFDKHICGFKNAGLSVWSWRNDTDGHVFNTYETVGTSKGYLVSANMHPVSSDDSRGQVGCLRFWYIIQTDGGAHLKLSQSYMDKTTSLKYNSAEIFELWSNKAKDINKWVHIEIPFSTSRPFKLIFESQFGGNNSYGTIALDDVDINYSKCREDYKNLGKTLTTKTTPLPRRSTEAVIPTENPNKN